MSCYGPILLRKVPLFKIELLSTGLFLDNGYLDMYVDLMNTGVNREYHYDVQRHRILPTSYLQKIGITDYRAQNNRVVLTVQDHILAHILLGMCTKDEYLISTNQKYLKAILKDLGPQIKEPVYDETGASALEFITDAERYAEIVDYIVKLLGTNEATFLFKLNLNDWYHENRSAAQLGKVKSEETRERMSKAKSGENNPCYGRTGEKNPMFGVVLSEEDRKKRGDFVRGSFKMHKENIEIWVKPEDVEARRNDGFELGALKRKKDVSNQ